MEHLRDGRSVSMRSVRGIQGDKTIFLLMTAFDGSTFAPSIPIMQHSAPMPDSPDPDSLMNQKEFFDTLDQSRVPDFIKHLQKQNNPIELRPSRHFHPTTPQKAPPDKQIMIQLKQPLTASTCTISGTGDSISVNSKLQRQRILAYVSDFGLMTTSLQPHGTVVFSPKIQCASLDHSMYFHKQFDDMDLSKEWLLHTTQSPVANDGRGFSIGSIYRRSTGDLLASTAQEGITRYRAS